MMISVNILGKDELKEWRDYIERSKDANFFHLPEWMCILKKVYGYRPVYLIARDGNTVCGVLPMFIVNSLTGKKRLKSLPFHFYGGPLYDSEEALGCLLKKAEKVCGEHQTNGLDIKSDLELEKPKLLNHKNLEIHKTKMYISYVTEISDPPDKLFWKLKKNVRGSITNSKDIEIKEIREKEDLQIFYNIYFECMKSLGLPGHPLKLFEEMWDLFFMNDMMRITVAYYEGKPIATIFVLLFNKKMLYMWGARDPEFKRMNANPALHWNALEWGYKNGFKSFDFGMTSPDEQSANFYKARWNSIKVPFHFYTLFSAPSKQGDYHTSFGLVKTVWRCIPSFIGRKLTPLIRYAG